MQKSYIDFKNNVGHANNLYEWTIQRMYGLRENPEEDVMTLYHGTPGSRLLEIVKNGFLISHQERGVVRGEKGIWFSTMETGIGSASFYDDIQAFEHGETITAIFEVEMPIDEIRQGHDKYTFVAKQDIPPEYIVNYYLRNAQPVKFR